MKKYIGVFDSGLGGLAVVKCLNKLLPNENIVFFGDNKRMPYGTKSKKTIRKYALENTNFINHFNLKYLGIACNTMDSNAKDVIVKNADSEVIGLIDITTKKANKVSKNKKIAVLATPATIKTHIYADKLKELNNKTKVYEIPCPLLASLIEEDADKEIIRKELKKYLNKLKDKDIDTIVLGCTHYHFVKDLVKELLANVSIVSSSYELANHIKKQIKEKNNTKGTNHFYVSKYYDEYALLIKKLLRINKLDIKEIDLKDYQ